MIPLFDLFSFLLAQTLRPLPTVLFTLFAAAIALAAAVSLKARADDPVRAWVQLITAIALTAWMLLPWSPAEPEVVAMNRAATVFAFGYITQDWLRESWRSGLDPRWVHIVVMLLGLLCITAVVLH